MSLVSIITPCYNSARYIRETVESVRAQTILDWEMVIVDDGSKDAPESAVADHLSEDSRLRLIRKENGGVASARNLGFRESCPGSRYLFFLDADDYLEPTALEELTQYLDAHPEVGMVYCDPILIDENSRELCDKDGPLRWQSDRWVPTRFWTRRVPPEAPETTLDTLFALTTIIPSMSLIRRSFYEQTPGFDESFGHLYEDMDLFMQIALRSQVHHYPKTLLRYRQHATQSTANKDKLWQQEQKLFEKWRHSLSSTLSVDDARRVEAALRFREGRIIPRGGFETAHKRLCRGEITDALRFFFGALRRYDPSLISPPTHTTGTPGAHYE